MHSPISILRFAAAAALLFPSMAMALNPSSTRATAPPLNPPAQGLTSLIGAPAVRSIDTNSERFARGLGPLPPRSVAGRRHHTGQEHGPGPKKSTPSGTPCQTLAASIAIYDMSGKQLGYVADDVNEFGEYVSTQESMMALKITYKQCGATGVIGPIEITQTNTCGCMPYKNVGAIQGYSSTSTDLAVGSYNYLYIGGVMSTPGLSTPVNAANSFTHTTNIPKSIESDAWYIDTASMNLSLQWVNNDGSHPLVHLALAGEILVATGDIQTFGSSVQAATEITLKVVAAI